MLTWTPALSCLAALIITFIIYLIINTRPVLPVKIRRLANIVLALIVVGVGLWLINTYVIMANSIKAILNIVIVIATCVMVLQGVGLWDDVVRFWNRLRTRASRETTEVDRETSHVEITPPGHTRRTEETHETILQK